MSAIRKHYHSFKKSWTTCGMILMYHRIAEVEQDPWGICVSPKNFEAHLLALTELKMTISEMDEIQQKRLGRKNIAITFDDGYADNFLNAKPILEKFQAPAAFFIVSGAVGSDKEFWWDHLERLIVGTSSLPEAIDYEINGQRYHWVVMKEAQDKKSPERTSLYCQIWKSLSALNPPEKDSALSQIQSQLKNVPAIYSDRFAMQRNQVEELSRSALMTIGSHTVSHPFLANLSEQEQRQEIIRSKTALEEVTGKDIRHFSCPHGSYTQATAAILKQAGYTQSCTSRDSNVVKKDDPYTLPRRVVENWDAGQFKQKITEWLSA